MRWWGRRYDPHHISRGVKRRPLGREQTRGASWPPAGTPSADTPSIGRANVDGTAVNQRFIRTASIPCGVAVYQRHIYWGEWTGRFADDPSTTIGRANLDGSAVNEQFITGIHDFCGGLAVG